MQDKQALRQKLIQKAFPLYLRDMKHHVCLSHVSNPIILLAKPKSETNLLQRGAFTAPGSLVQSRNIKNIFQDVTQQIPQIVTQIPRKQT